VDEGVRIKLREILSAQGEALRRDPQRMEAILRDHCPEDRREIHMLMSAARAGIVEDLAGGWGAGPPEMLVARLSKRLHEDMGIAPPLARWTVESWAYALYNVRFRPRTEPRPAVTATGAAAAKTSPGGSLDRGLAFLASIPSRIRDKKDPYRLHLLAGVLGAGVLLVAGGMALLSRFAGKEPAHPPRGGQPGAQAPAPATPGSVPANGTGAGPREGEGEQGSGEKEGGLTPSQAVHLLRAQFPREEFQVSRVVQGSFTAPDTREAVFAVTSSGFSPMECKSRLWLARDEGVWRLVEEVAPKVTAVAQVVDVDMDGISEIVTSYSCIFRGSLEESQEVISLKGFPGNTLRRLFTVTETGSQAEGTGTAPPPIPYHEIRFREYPGEEGLILRDEITDPVLKSRRCKNYRLKYEVYAPAEDIRDC
jgi:hypothetical protein